MCENTRQVQSVPLADESCCRGLFRLGERSERRKKRDLDGSKASNWISSSLILLLRDPFLFSFVLILKKMGLFFVLQLEILAFASVFVTL